MLMQREQIVALLKAHRADLDRFGIRSLALFGSAARDELNAHSDIDVLVDFGEPVTFDRYMDTKPYLEDLLERPIDLVTRRALRPQLKPTVERELLYVA
jgi:predicted nucleotidyltransferase